MRTTSASKRRAALKRRLGVRLLQRTTRRIGLTPEGETYLREGARVLEELDALERQVAGSRAAPKGLVRVAATLGFGRRHVAPVLSRFVRQYPEVHVQLHLTDQPVHIVEQGFDLEVRVGELPDARLSARLLAHNQRALLAAPAYLRRAGTPMAPRELARHACCSSARATRPSAPGTCARVPAARPSRCAGRWRRTMASPCWAGRWTSTAW